MVENTCTKQLSNRMNLIWIINGRRNNKQKIISEYNNKINGNYEQQNLKWTTTS